MLAHIHGHTEANAPNFPSDEDTSRFEQIPENKCDQNVLENVSANTREMRRDGYINLLNKYGSSHDNSTAYTNVSEAPVPDIQLSQYYETSGLFARIIDLPAEEAVKHGFDSGIRDQKINAYINDMVDWLEWEEKAAIAIKWSRLFGGALIVMLIDDGHGIDEPLDWRNIKSIEELRVYERAVVQPDYSSLYNYSMTESFGETIPKFAMPEYYFVSSLYGKFKVHESRCLIFRNGVLPERSTQPSYRFWGAPEYLRIRKELREVVTSHSYAVKLLERSSQAIYSMKNLASVLQTDEGTELVLKRLQIIDMARNILNSIAIDSEGEQYDFKSMQLSGVNDVIDTTCNMLSAVTGIPQTVLFGRSPAGQNSTGKSDLENYYNLVERIQKLMLRSNLKTFLDIIIRAGFNSGKIDCEPDFRAIFKPLWNLSEAEQAETVRKKAQAQNVRANTAKIYVEMGVLDSSEIRASLAKDKEFDIETVLDSSLT